MNLARNTFTKSRRIFWRSYVTPQAKPLLRDQFRGPVFKTLFLTVVFGSVVVDSTRRRKELENLRSLYDAKFQILRDVTEKIKARVPVDVTQELRIANAITKNKFISATDVELDELLEDFLKYAEGLGDEEQPEEPQVVFALESATPPKKSSDFL